MAKLLILALLCVALTASTPAPDFELEDEPRSLDVTSPEDEDEFEDEPRSADSDLESVDGDDDYSVLVPDMRDDAEELADNNNSDALEHLEPSDRQFWRRRSRRAWRRFLRTRRGRRFARRVIRASRYMRRASRRFRRFRRRWG